jgi:hypothetical protein
MRRPEPDMCCCFTQKKTDLHLIGPYGYRPKHLNLTNHSLVLRFLPAGSPHANPPPPPSPSIPNRTWYHAAYYIHTKCNTSKHMALWQTVSGNCYWAAKLAFFPLSRWRPHRRQHDSSRYPYQWQTIQGTVKEGSWNHFLQQFGVHFPTVINIIFF